MFGFDVSDDRFEPLRQEEHECARADRAEGEYRHGEGHDLGRFVRVRGSGACGVTQGHSIGLPTWFPEEGHDHDAGHVERGQSGTEQGGQAVDGAHTEGNLDDLVFGEEPGERRNADDREIAESERHERDG